MAWPNVPSQGPGSPSRGPVSHNTPGHQSPDGSLRPPGAAMTPGSAGRSTSVSRSPVSPHALQGSKASVVEGGKAAASEKGSMGAKLEDEMNNDHLVKLQEIFEEADEDGGGGLDIDEFRMAMRKIMGEGMMEEVDDQELAIVFMKVDANCDGTVDWDEYLSYMLLEYQEKDHMSNLFKDIPFPKPLREITSNHRDVMTKVAFYQTLNLRHGSLTDEGGEHGGRYISVSKEGIVNFWTIDMSLIRSCSLEQPREKSMPMWLTDMVCMPNVNMIAISSTERDISFFDVNANKFDRCFQVTGLEHCALTMDYWFDPRNMNKAVLCFGDAGGSVCCVVFTEALGAALFGSQNAKSVGSRRVPFPELLKGTIKGVQALRWTPLHDDWVRKVKYCANLNSFVSCATTNETSLFIGDLERKKSGNFFQIRKGILCFDYSKDANIIVTGGMDRSVRMWNPYVTTKATAMMKGHTSAVCHIVVNQQHGHIISVGKDKGIKVWDMRDQTCLQNINPRNINLGPHVINTVCFHTKTGSLILGTNQLALLEHKWETEAEEDENQSHNKPITAALYNSLFNQVVSACHDSVVSVWDLGTGTKTIQFSNAHKYIEKGQERCAEITAMTFDPSGRRLVTGGRNGSVKIWNFNNGACLRELEGFDNFEVTGIVCPKQRIVTAGWNRRISTYIDSDDDDDSRQWMQKHKEDILSLSSYQHSLIATSSYDGDIYIWSLETAHPLCRLNANESIKPRTGSHTVSRGVDEVESLERRDSADRLTRRGSGNKFPRKADSAGSHHSYRSMNEEQDSGDGNGDGSLTPKSHHSIAPVRTQSKDESRTTLPAIARHRSLMDKRNSQNFEEERAAAGSRTFFTESLNGGVVNDNDAAASVDLDEEQKEEVEKEEEKELFDRKHECAVDKVIFLESRPHNKETATLMASGAEGWVRAWSCHHRGGLLGQFHSAHKPGESVLAMTTDSENEFLIIGDTLGYVKVWDISDYCISIRDAALRQRNSSPAMDYIKSQKRFPYTQGKPTLLALQARMEERARNAVHPPAAETHPDQTIKWPPKLNSFRAHMKGITHIEYAEDKQLIITSSGDCSVRLWTLCGKYIGTFGQRGGWPKLPEGVVYGSKIPRRMPRDIQRIASAMTLKVFNGGATPRWRLAKNIMMIIAGKKNFGFGGASPAAIRKDDFEVGTSSEVNWDDDETDDERHDKDTSWKTSSILGKSYKPKTRHKMTPQLPDIKHNQSQVVVYSSLPFTDLEPVQEPLVPQTIHEIQLRHQQSSDQVGNAPGGGGHGKSKQGKQGNKRSKLHEYLQKHRAVKLLTRKSTPGKGEMSK